MPRRQRPIRIERGLYRVGDTWWACVTPKGRRQAEWEKLGDVGRQEARRLRDEFAYRISSGAAPVGVRRQTVREAASRWHGQLDELERDGELRTRTVTSYKDGLRLHFVPEFGSRQVASITPDDLVAWHESQRRSGAATWSIRARWMGIRGLFGYAARSGIIPANPCDVLVRRERPKPGKAKGRYLTELEIEALIGRATGDGASIASLLLFSGLRASEALGLIWSEIDFAQKVIHVRYQMSRRGQRLPLKTDSGRRDVILMDQLAHVLRRRRLATPFSRDDALVLTNGIGNTLGYTRFRSQFAEVVERAELAAVTPHTCRHTFASLLIDQGATVEFVSDQLGHASTKTTWDIYVHLFRRREHAEAARLGLDAAFGPMLRAMGQEPEVR